MQDFDHHMIGMDLANAALDLPVVEEDGLSRLRRGENFGKRARDVREIAMLRQQRVFVSGQHQ